MLSSGTLAALVLFCFTLKVLGHAVHAVPQTIQLQSRSVSQGFSLRRRALSPTTLPLADFFWGTDLQYVPNFNSPFFLTNSLSRDGSEIYQVTI